MGGESADGPADDSATSIYLIVTAELVLIFYSEVI